MVTFFGAALQSWPDIDGPNNDADDERDHARPEAGNIKAHISHIQSELVRATHHRKIDIG
jgi:hypothetical protein